MTVEEIEKFMNVLTDPWEKTYFRLAFVTGLRKGEKLFEELLIDGKAYPTNHPLIYKAKEELINSNDFWDKISTLEKYIKEQDENNTLKILSKLVPEWINKN